LYFENFEEIFIGILKFIDFNMVLFLLTLFLSLWIIVLINKELLLTKNKFIDLCLYSLFFWLITLIREPFWWILYSFLTNNLFWTYSEIAIPHFNWYSSNWSYYGWILYWWVIYSLKHRYQIFKTFKWIFLLPIIAIFREILVNIISLIFLWQQIFYYYPWDLFHFSSLFVYPFYLILSYALYGIEDFFLIINNLKNIIKIKLILFLLWLIRCLFLSVNLLI
jgi:hypothetical protein